MHSCHVSRAGWTFRRSRSSSESFSRTKITASPLLPRDLSTAESRKTFTPVDVLGGPSETARRLRLLDVCSVCTHSLRQWHSGIEARLVVVGVSAGELPALEVPSPRRVSSSSFPMRSCAAARFLSK